MLHDQISSQNIFRSALFEIDEDEFDDSEADDDRVEQEVEESNRIFSSDVFDNFDDDLEFQTVDNNENIFNQSSSSIALEDSFDSELESVQIATNNLGLSEDEAFINSDLSETSLFDTDLFDPGVVDIEALGSEPFDTELIGSNRETSADNNNIDPISGVELNQFSSNLEIQDRLLTYFNDDFYRQQNPDVDEAIRQGSFDSGLEQFIAFGLAENRIVNPFFDEAFYRSSNADVSNAIATGGFRSGVEHFIKNGIDEGRNPGAGFDSSFYLSQNPDVALGIENGAFDSAFQHFWLFGQFEGRTSMGDIG